MIRPYVPSLRNTAARRTDPTVGALLCASGSQVCSGTSGVLTAKPSTISTAATSGPPSISVNCSDPLSRATSTMPTSSNAEPVTVNSRNLVAAACAPGRVVWVAPPGDDEPHRDQRELEEHEEQQEVE